MKKNLLGLFAVVLAIAFSAFTVEKKAQVIGTWYEFTAQVDNDQTDPLNYTYREEQPDCEESAKLCAILIDDTNTTLSPGELSTFFTNNDTSPLGNLDDESTSAILIKKQ